MRDALYDEVNAEFRGEAKTIAGDFTLTEAAQQCRDSLWKERLDKKSTQRAEYEQFLRDYVLPTHSSKNVRDIVPKHFYDLLPKLRALKDENGERKLGDVRILKVKAAWSSIMRIAVEMGWTTTNPIRDAQFKPVKPETPIAGKDEG